MSKELDARAREAAKARLRVRETEEMYEFLREHEPGEFAWRLDQLVCNCEDAEEDLALALAAYEQAQRRAQGEATA